MSTVMPNRTDTRTRHRSTSVDGIDVFYREAGPKDAPQVVLLHGFPTSSRMFRNLIPHLADAYHVIAPDYPGFGYTSRPPRGEFTYNFDNVAELIEKFLDQQGFDRYVLYMMDFGGSIGWRLAVKHPDRVTGVVLQNAPLYREEGGTFWQTLMPYWADGSAEHRDAARAYVSLEATKDQYVYGVDDPTLVDPDVWNLDQAQLERPGVDEIMLDYLYDIRLQAGIFAKAREFLQTRQPPALVATGAKDNIFPEATMRNFLTDLPDADFHALDAGHFALETNADEIGTLMRSFLDRNIAMT